MTSRSLSGKRYGFTMVEIIVVIVIIAILATIVAVGASRVQQQSRDSKRGNSVKLIAQSLENYYQKYGEYPSCKDMTEAPDTIKSTLLPNLDPAVLKSPTGNQSDGNSIICGELPDDAGSNVYAFVGDGSTECDTGAACLSWTLEYREESTGKVVSLSSNHQERVATSGTPTIHASAHDTTRIDVNWNPVVDATSYTLQRSTKSDMSGAVSTSIANASTSVTGLTPGTKYYFRVRAVTSEGVGGWSNITSATTTVTAPSGTPTIAATLPGGTTARGTASGGGTCVTGTTLETSVRHQINGGSWSGWAVTSSQDVAAEQGGTYAFQSRIRCKGASASSSYKTSSVASVTRSVTAPTGVAINAKLSGTNAVGTATGTCSSGVTVQRQIRYQKDGGSWSGWSTTSSRSVAASQGSTYTFQSRARCTAHGHYSAYVNSSSNDSTTRPVDSPTGVKVSAHMSGANAVGTASSSCTSGATITRQIRYQKNGGSWSGWSTTSSKSVAATQGAEYTFQSRARCTANGTSTAYKNSSTDSVVRAVAAPSSVTISAKMSGTSAVGTAGGGSCASGTTLVRQIRYRKTATSTAGSWSSYSTTSSRSVGATQGWQYTFQAHARCEGAHDDSAWKTSGTDATVRPITSVPGVPQLTVTTSGSYTTFKRTSVSCPTGNSVQYRIRQVYDAGGTHWGYDTGWGSAVTNGFGSVKWNTSAQGYEYKEQVDARCHTSYDSGSYSAADTAGYIRPVSTPGKATKFDKTVVTRFKKYRDDFKAPACGPGTTQKYQFNLWTSWGGWGPWSAMQYASPAVIITFTPAASAGQTYKLEFRYACYNPSTGRHSSTGPTAVSPLYSI